PKLDNLKNMQSMTEKEAKKYLQKNNIAKNKEEESAESTPKGEVIRQEPEAVPDLNEGSPVAVYISLGPEEKPPVSHDVTFTVPYNPKEGDIEKDADSEET